MVDAGKQFAKIVSPDVDSCLYNVYNVQWTFLSLNIILNPNQFADGRPY